MVDITALAGLFALVSSMLMQMLKPFVERIPGIMLPANQQLHDSLLQLVVYAMNLALMVAAYHSPGTGLQGLQWFDLLAIALGQTAISHGNYKLQTMGKVDAPTPAPAPSPGATP